MAGREEGEGQRAVPRTGDASFEMCTKIKIFLGKEKVNFCCFVSFFVVR